ncbi:MAG: IS3 family transposase, partial [Saccharospirillum sp.]|nr:IS3 family transposase [Saccharospirillum sp.]
LHSGINFVTPGARHRGEDKALLAQRKMVYEAAKEKNPQRWSGETRNWTPVEAVALNPSRKLEMERNKMAA